ncbi:MAG: HAMP domain-containing sensor histidine kinase [Clostridia bacterium]
MRLWLKQTLLALTIILGTVSACLYFFTAVQTQSLLEQAEENGFRSVNAFCEHLSTLERTGSVDASIDGTTKTALIQYTFSTYAHLLQSAENAYSLVGVDGYLYNATQSDPISLLPMTERDISASRITMVGGAPFLVQGMNIVVLETPVTVYLTQRLTATYANMDSLTQSAQIALGACLLLCSILLPLLFCKSLRPLRRLTKVTRDIADGNYALRADSSSQDEVGELSASFDQMAETVEQKILTLEDTAKRRELLLGALTHEMKTPMTAIIGYSQSLLTMPLTEEKRMDAANEIYEAARRTERLSQKMMQLISMTDCPALVRRDCDTRALFAQAAQAVQPLLAEKGIVLTIESSADTLFGDSDLLFTLLTNLIRNSVHASPSGTTITLCATLLADKVRLQVADQGSGIPADKISLVAEPFYRVDKARSRKLGGAGLGLSICQMIAQAHGSRLEIESTLGKGTTISVDLPIKKEGAIHE